MPHPTRLAAIGSTLLTATALGVWAGPAQAATTGLATVVETTKVQYKAAKGQQNRVVVTRSGNTVTVDDRVAVKAGKGCKAVKGDKTKVRCTTSKAPTRIRVYTYDRVDSIVNRTGLGMTADGGSADDTVTGGPRGDILRGGTGKDKLYGLGGADDIQGGDGNDRLSGGDGDDYLDGGENNDTLYGDNGSDQLSGWSGNDRMYGGAGNDTLRSNAYAGGSDNDYFSGGRDRDTVDYFAYERSVTADADGVSGDDGQKGEHDTIATDVEVIQGGQAGDRLSGTSRADILIGGPGNDWIYGYGGDDALVGELGADVLDGGTGNDYLTGDDASMGKVSADVLRGGPGRDRVDYLDHTKPVSVDLDGVKGDDGQAGEHDTVGADVEDLVGGSGSDRLVGNAAANEIWGSAGNDVIWGGAGNDSLTGDDGRDSIYGQAGDDDISGADGYSYDTPDRLDGGVNGAAGDRCEALTNDVAYFCER